MARYTIYYNKYANVCAYHVEDNEAPIKTVVARCYTQEQADSLVTLLNKAAEGTLELDDSSQNNLWLPYSGVKKALLQYHEDSGANDGAWWKMLSHLVMLARQDGIYIESNKKRLLAQQKAANNKDK